MRTLQGLAACGGRAEAASAKAPLAASGKLKTESS